MNLSQMGDGHLCASCSKSAALSCKGCKASPDGTGGVVNVFYCGISCQKEDWTTHKIFCKAAKDRLVLYRAGDFAKDMLLMFNKITYKWNVGSIEKNGNTWYIRSGADRASRSQLVPFPHALVPEQRDEEALLTYQSCNAALAYMHEFIRSLVQGENSHAVNTNQGLPLYRSLRRHR